MKRTIYTIIAIAGVLLSSCSSDQTPITISEEHLHKSVEKVTEIMIHDIFSPPVASRIYVYPNITAYEIIARNTGAYPSLYGQIEHLPEIPASEDPEVNASLAALIAHMELSKSLIFSEERMQTFQDSLYGVWQEQNEREFEASKEYADQVVTLAKQWLGNDNYKETRTMPKFTVNSDDPSRWQPTPPAYMDGIEPHWMKIRPMVLNSADQFKPAPPPAFSMEEGSDFHKELMEVYEVSNRITDDNSEEVAIAQFWDCNPYVSVTRGHLMFATKKITPGAHWIGICKIASKKSGFDFATTLHAYTKTSIAIFDGFISCWDEKYRSNLIRPETLINQHIDENWKPILQTPPFPEYTSGHSVVSGAAATVLTSIFGDDFAFDDDTELPYGLPVRSFSSFNSAADEAAISRMYGGIHYRAAIEVGVKQGRSLGHFVVDQLVMKNKQEELANNQ
ncbi:phosphatase PAP2 family protein [Robertkochia marina]|uniref:Phosphatase PAP2 family protein n=1 Tax=Robertkochia marina TaxID=1227945 RepID=A0A4S3M6A7_9FLAO|nr:vanadium-dependent haloperoxidase [Robertkochia marina]THD69757.1 phosphatase PAP2 family protein [Robertkochia marina]TRZ46900.1 phosphatase PAP2 family protein [Robertkochia marina]